MGAGKTTLGKDLADLMNVPFYDLDSKIEEMAGLSIFEIFMKQGEKAFRKLETQCLLNSSDNAVIATGGGVIEHRCNRDYLKLEDHLVIWLNESFEIMMERIKHSSRPLVNSLSSDNLKSLYFQRKPLYEEVSDLVCDKLTAINIFNRIQLFLK